MLQKTIQRKVGNPETVRLYKFSSSSEMNEIIADYKQNFSRSVTIIDNGRFNKAKTTFINSLATETWDDLRISDTDYFLLTREDLAIKDADEKRKNRLAKRGISTLDTSSTLSPIKPFKTGRVTDWTPAEMAKLYSGTIKEVAAALNRTYAMVYTRRKKYEEENPTFVVPECATRPVAQKVVKEKPAYKQIVSELTQAEVDILWNNSSSELRAKYAGIFQSIFVIAAMRTEYCKMNPDFVIPLAAKFSPNGLSNKVEQKVRANAKAETKLISGLTEDQMSLIWEGTGKEVGAIINKHPNAIYHARIAYCKANPEFIIPAISGFKPPVEVTNRVEIVQPTILTEVVAEVKEVKETIIEPKIEVTEPVVAIKKKRGRKPKEAVVAMAPTVQAPVQAPVPPVEQPASQQNTMAEMFTLLTASGMKPKKATFTKDGECCFEF
jgi:hypothetical protein